MNHHNNGTKERNQTIAVVTTTTTYHFLSYRTENRDRFVLDGTILMGIQEEKNNHNARAETNNNHIKLVILEAEREGNPKFVLSLILKHWTIVVILHIEETYPQNNETIRKTKDSKVTEGIIDDVYQVSGPLQEIFFGI